MIKVLLLLFCALVIFTRDAEGVCCGTSCGLQCTVFPPGCKVKCGYQCGSCIRRRRDTTEEHAVENDLPKPQVHAFKIVLPYKFSDYDENNDGRISFDEYKDALPPVKDTRGIKKGFEVYDKDGDSYIDCKEFLKANLDTDGKKLVC